MNAIEFNLNQDNGPVLYVRAWEPETPPKAVLVLIHGLGEHSGRYEAFAETFLRAGIAVCAMDLRGHGRSEGRRGHAPNYRALLSDISDLLRETRFRYPHLPTVLYGHSLGGNLAMVYALQKKPVLAGVIAASPLLRIANPPPAWKRRLIRLMNRLHLNVSIRTQMDTAALSRAPEITEAYRNDPLVHDRITPSLAVTMIEQGEWCIDQAAHFPLHLLLMHGSADHITSPEASVAFSNRSNALCTFHLWENFHHELHNEPNKEQVFTAVIRWIETLIR
ncbi:MAG: lysophospholipase [Pontiellaceae bacterium]|nr:lysophospholipase [Pontiellaceae bacterium]MBN2785913.1 lysophospholipase [Pontiellaceae bacterium]